MHLRSASSHKNPSKSRDKNLTKQLKDFERERNTLIEEACLAFKDQVAENVHFVR